MATCIHHPENPSLETKTVAAFNRVAISGSGGNNSGFRKIVHFQSNSPQRSRSQTSDRRRVYNREALNQDPNQNSNWGNQKSYESQRCYICDKKGHLARQCLRANRYVNQIQKQMRNNQQNYRHIRYDNKPNTQFQRYSCNSFQREAGRKGNKGFGIRSRCFEGTDT